MNYVLIVLGIIILLYIYAIYRYASTCYGVGTNIYTDYKFWILIVVLLALAYLAYMHYISTESFTHTKRPQVMIADGHCNSNVDGSMADYYTKLYPYYPDGGYFKPLDSEGYTTKTQDVDFENKNYTTLYTSRL